MVSSDNKDKMADMSGPPSIFPKPDPVVEVAGGSGPYGLPDKLTTGLSSVKSTLSCGHPLEASELKYAKNQEKLDMRMLRNTQGLHAPLRLQMERAVTSKIQRLPGLPSSHLALDTLLGTDEWIGFEDFLNAPGDSEVQGNTHLMMEAKLGLL